jgi:alpha-glucosidase (family GH31 glycosyl hydrolase)
MASFVSIGNLFEFFLFGTTRGPKINQRLLSEVTGYPPMPPIYSLGYHYAKWEKNSADLMIKRNEEFTTYGFPVDVLWSDIYYAQDFEYFVFNREKFPINKVQ